MSATTQPREIHRHDSVLPDRPETWGNERWVEGYELVKEGKGGLVERDRAADLLRFAGYKHPEPETVAKIVQELLPYPKFGPVDVYKVLERYDSTMRGKWKQEFDNLVSQDGFITMAQLDGLMLRFSFAPVPDTMADVLAEANEIRQDSCVEKGLVSFQLFLRVMNIMDTREGFCSAELARLEKTFKWFDRDQSGKIDPSELSSVIVWLGFVQDSKLIEGMLVKSNEGNSDTTDAPTIDLDMFLYIMRKHRLLEYTKTKDMFEGFDSDKDGILNPEELVRLFNATGITLLPESLVDAVDDIGLDPERFSFGCMWKLLQYLRDREGFTNSEVQTISDVFDKFDHGRAGEISSRKVRNGLRWLGYLLNPQDEAAQKIDWSHLVHAHTGCLALTEFRYLVRRHQEADLRATREVFRLFADNGGARPMRKKQLRRAVKKLNPCYLDDYMAWLRNNLPAQWMFSSHAKLDFEDFRRLVNGCRERVCERLRSNHGFTDMEAAHLRIVFVRHTKEVGTVATKQQGELFKSLIPAIEISSQARNRLKKAMEMAKCTKDALTWERFLLVMSKHAELLEHDEDQLAPKVVAELGIPRHMTDRFFEIYKAFTRPGGVEFGLGAADVCLLTHSRPEMKMEHQHVFADLLVGLSRSEGVRAAPGPVEFAALVCRTSDPEYVQKHIEEQAALERRMSSSSLSPGAERRLSSSNLSPGNSLSRESSAALSMA